VKYAEPNATYRVQYTPDDPYYSDQYAPQQIGADTAWNTTLGDCGCSIAIVGQGVDCSHPDLCYCNTVGYDFVDGDDDPSPDDPSSEYHGTAVAGIAAAKTDNGEAIAGIADASLVVARALDGSGTGSTSDIADAIAWAADRGADVILLAFGGPEHSDTLENAVAYAHEQGSLLVGAAGNDYGGSVSYPAAYEECIAVSAVDNNENLANFSNVGPEIELAAPGEDVLTTTTDARGSYEQLSGTSMAAAIVSGVAGLTHASWGIEGSELRRHLKATAVDGGNSSDEQGCGRVDAANAVYVDPGDSGTCGDSGIGVCGDRSVSSWVDDSLSGAGDADCWKWTWEYDDPCEVVVELDGPLLADFDLYANEGVGDCPTATDQTHSSTTSDSQESITVEEPDASAPVYVLVHSASGSGDYTLTITEKAR
jgi:serine protease